MSEPTIVTMEAKVAELRLAADRLRENPTAIPRADFAVMVADWIDAEASLLGLFEPLVDAFNMGLTNMGHPVESHLSLGRTESGEVKMQSDTSHHAQRIADALEQHWEAVS